MIIYLLIFLLILFIWNRVKKNFKFPKCSSIAVFTGGVKTGKSALSLSCAIGYYKSHVRKWRFKCVLRFIANRFRKKSKRKSYDEKPLFYSNIPIRGIDYVPLTNDHILRKVRFNFKSVVFVDEASLMADSQLIKVNDLNVKLLLFFKLFGHETHGGICVFNSHNISDLHYALKRCTSQYFYIHHLTTFLPFFVIGHMREERFSEDGTDLNVYNEDIELTMLKLLRSKKIFKMYDSFCYSNLTDNLPLKNDIQRNYRGDSLKAKDIPSFRSEFQNLFKEFNSNEKKDS